MKRKILWKKIITGASGFVLALSFMSLPVYGLEGSGLIIESSNAFDDTFKSLIQNRKIKLNSMNKWNPSSDYVKKAQEQGSKAPLNVIANKEMNDLLGYSAAHKSLVAEKVYKSEIINDKKTTSSLSGFGLGGGNVLAGIPKSDEYRVTVIDESIRPSSMDFINTKLGSSVIGNDAYLESLKKTDAITYKAVKDGKVDIAISNDPLIRNTTHQEYNKSKELNKAAAMTAFESSMSGYIGQYKNYLSNNIPSKVNYSAMSSKGFTLSTKLAAPPAIKKYDFKNPAPTLNKDALLDKFTSGLNVEGNEVVEKAYESFMKMQGGKK